MKRGSYLQELQEAFEIHPIVAILGPRQCGKTTLAKQYARFSKTKFHYFDLEDPEDLLALEKPKLLFESFKEPVIIDEIQRRQELFPYLRALVDREKRKRKILILGSASKDLVQESSESLAGRISYIELTPFSLREVPVKELGSLWMRGGFPLSFLASTGKKSFEWRKSYIGTFLERDIPSLGIQIPATTMRRFWLMLSHYHGQVVNYSEIGRSFGIADTTVRKYIDILSETFMIRSLKSWHENIKKRQVKQPKLYFRDSGIYHSILGLNSKRELFSHPKLGASWEGFALEQVISHFKVDREDAYFWAVHGQGELDLFFQKNGKRYGVEFRFSDSPKLSYSMRCSLEHLKLDYLYCIYPGEKFFPLESNILACGMKSLKKIKLKSSL